MNKTQKIIILVGNENLVRTALNTIQGFKAVTVVKSLSNRIIQTVFRHNKNIVFAQPVYKRMFKKYKPIIINIVKKGTDVKLMRLGLENVIEDFPMLLDSQDVDSGDHISNNSTDFKKVACDCLLCKIAKGTPKYPEHILYESNNFFVVPGLGAFFDGYVMIVPKKHIMSFAELDEPEYEEFLQVLNDIKFILQQVYKKRIFVFECGSGRNGGGKHATSIVHAHIHLAPTNMPVLKNIHKSGLHPAIISSRDLCNYGEHPYMLYVDQEDNWYISSDPDTYFPRQHPRQVLADYMGLKKGEYNWRTNPLREKMDIIADEIYSFLRNNFDSIPTWIQEAVSKFI